ncbi:MAG TPA: magnesium transporter CorA family protein [Candidatus Deferrimicrobiaceae bacterium]|nr:magnesium transporter CorA family protein [Candidatus Deferrimicrobiaceae bacterium]
MIRYVDLQTNIEKEIQPEDVETFSLTNVWFELVDPTENELQAVAEAVDISINFLRLPKSHSAVDLRLEPDFGVINFLVMQDVVATKKVYPMVIVFAKNFLLTISKKEVQSMVNIAKARMSKAKIDPPSGVAYFIIDEIIADHYIHIEKLEGVTSKIEEEVLEKNSSETLKHIFKLKTNMVRFNKILWYERGLVFNLRKCSDDCMPAKVRALFDTTHEDLTRQIDIVETYREILSDAINVHLSAVSNKINLSIQGLTVVIFYLTIITTLTSFPNTIATFFGISQFGNTDIAIVAVAILLSIALPFVWLWRKKWLRFPKMQ